MASTPADAPLVVVDKVTETRSIDDSQAESHTILFDIFGNEKPRVGWQTGLMLSMETVLGRSALGGRGPFCAWRVMLKRVFTRVDLLWSFFASFFDVPLVMLDECSAPLIGPPYVERVAKASVHLDPYQLPRAVFP